ncbi:MAG: hypothetical protein KGI56_05005, partial [Acidobacteriota bacterium]|nr:hypothetical protein [Acidobacteriota bacterium]
MKDRALGIQARTFLAFGTFALLVLTVGGWAIARYFEAISLRQIERQQHRLVVVIAGAMDRTIALHRATLEATCRTVPGDILDDAPAAHRWLERHRAIRALFEDGIFLVRPDGTLLADDMKAPLSAPLQAALQPFFRSVAARGESLVSDVYRSEHSGGPAFIMAAPLLGADGRTRLLLAGSLDLADDDFLGNLGGREIPDACRLSLMDRQGRILLHPEKARLFTRIQSESWGHLLDEPSGGSGVRLDATGTPVLTSTQRLRATPWTLAASVPFAVARAPIDRFRSYLRAATALTLLGVLALTWFLSHRLTEGLAAFTTDVRAAMSRPAGQRSIPRRGNDEVGLLVDAFNALMANLDGKAARLFRAIASQDQELALAKDIFQRLVGPGLRALPPHLYMETLQTGRVNGDACAYRE